MTDPLYVRARRVLLDALEALREHRSAVVLVGAQAVYLRVGGAGLAVAPYTTDGDLALDPRILADEPLLFAALAGADLHPRKGSPGVWIGGAKVQIDLLVPEELGGRRGRGALLGAHGTGASRQVKGLAGTLVDSSLLSVAALDPGDQRRFDVGVAEVGGLMVAKLHKIHDRSGSDRQTDKDALDVLRLMRGSPPGEVARRLARLRADPLAGPTTKVALELLGTLFAAADAEGSRMAAQAAFPFAPVAEIESSCAALAEEILVALGLGP